MDLKGKKRKIADENRGFKEEWTELYAFIANAEGLPACLICNEKLSNNKKSNLERHFQLKHAKFAADHPVGTERKSAIALLVKRFEGRKNSFKKWIAVAGVCAWKYTQSQAESLKHVLNALSHNKTGTC